jgi:Protein of unknown function (DUF2510)
MLRNSRFVGSDEDGGSPANIAASGGSQQTERALGERSNQHRAERASKHSELGERSNRTRLKGVSVAPRPGWYPDPAGATGLYRWWDGDQWADVTSDSANAPPPIPVPAESAYQGVSTSRAASPLRVATAMSLGFVLFISASIGLGLVIWRDQSPTSAERVTGGSAGRPSAGGVSSDPVGYLDEGTRTATIGAASLTMPGDPYVLSPDPMAIRGVLDLLFWASAPIHPRYDGQHDWSSGVLLGRVSDSSSQGDLESEGRLALHRLSTAIFDEHPTQVTRLTSDTQTVDGRPGMLFSAQVHYRVDRLPSRYDTVTALVVRLDDGSLIMAASSVPNDADSDVARQAAEALKTLSVR